MLYAPIALFTYNRADHTKSAVESLLKNAEAKDSDLYIFSDGPKTEEKREAVEENRRYIHSVTGFKSIQIIERRKNWGLANSLIAGITEVINQYGKIIVVEDDLVLSPYFLKFMNEGLDKYEKEEVVGAICGFATPVFKNLPETYFLHFMHPWGWATWKRAWRLFNPDAKDLIRKIRFKTNRFNLGGNCGSYENLYGQKVGLVDSWYIRFYASLYLNNKLVLFSKDSLTSNSGLDNSGTHCHEDFNGMNKVLLAESPIKLNNIAIKENRNAYNAYKEYYDYYNQNYPTIIKYYGRLKSFLRRLFYIDCL